MTGMFRRRFGTGQSSAPALLVSVRGAEEAMSALAGGADVLDVKEPLRGPLGAADEETLRTVAAAVRSLPEPRTLTAALGEALEMGGAKVQAVPEGYSFCKLGMSWLRHRANWEDRWRKARLVFEDRAGRSLEWVAVAYADDVAAGSPPIGEVLAAGRRARCRGLLIDTFDKSAGRLTDFLTPGCLEEVACEAHESGMFLAVAGRLRVEDLRQLREHSVDVVGVRSAACAGELRGGQVTREQTERCRTALDRSEVLRRVC
jgi:(5-formylfuran-3-yl)methyl phosphate synthase